MKHSLSSAIFWVFVALAAVLLAPYAGIHIITSPAPPLEAIDVTPATFFLEQDSDAESEQATQDDKPPPFSPPGSLQEIEGLLEE